MNPLDLPPSALLAPLTIAHVVYSSHIAGGERHCIDLAQAQAAVGHRVHVVGPARSAVAAEVGPAVEYHGVALPILRGFRLRRLVRKLQADVCHAHLGPACKAAAQLSGVTRIGTLHVGYKAHHHAQLDGLICVNRAQKAHVGDFRGMSCVIHNWAPVKSVGWSGDLRAELGLTPDQLLVGSVGRLHPSKGMDVLVSAFKLFAPADAALAILGEGDELPRLKILADGDPRIHLLGFRSDVDAALCGMDLFVSPSREEAFPLAILEAMRAGLPVIASATQGPTEMLSGQPGTLVPIGDIAALGQALETSLSELRPRSRAAREKVVYDLTRYDRQKAVDRVLAFYRAVLGDRQASSGARRLAHQGAGHA